jgi:hypothetical protein
VAFPLDIRTELLLNGAWSDISSDVYVRDAKQISRGRRDQGQATDPSSLSLTINNKSGKYSPRNAMSPLYGQIGRNTQLRVSVPATDKYLSLDGDPANYVSTPDTAALDITGDIDVRAEISPNWYGPDSQMLIGKWDAPGNQRSWLLRLNQGQLTFNFTTTGISDVGTGFFFARSLQEIPARGAVRVTLDADNGAGGRTVQFYTSTSITGTWVPLGGPIVLSGYGTTPMFSGSAPLVIGGTDLTVNPKRYPMIGRGYKYEVRNGIGGTVVASPDFTAQAAGATSFTDSAGLLWTLNGGAQIRDREDRFLGEVSTWPSKWTPDESDVYVPIQANGILRRLGQGTKALDSTLRRRIPSGSPIAYWPMEDGQYSTRAWSPIPGVDSAVLSGVEWASASDLPSSGPLPKLGASGTLSAPIPATMPSGEWQVEFVYNADDKIPPAGPAPMADVIAFSSPNGAVRQWKISMQHGAAHVAGYNSSGTDIVDSLIGVGDDIFHGWTRLRLWAKDTGSGTFDWRINWQDVGGDAGGLGGNETGSCGRLSAITANWGALTEGWAIGHLSVLPTSGSTLYDGSDDAYTGETAWNRIMRLAIEESVPVERIHGLLTSEAVGPQRPETLVDLFEEAASADNGFLLESLNRVGLVFRDRSSMYTQDPALTLSYNEAGLAPDLEPVDDDSAVRNDIEVTRDGGSSARAYLSDGPLSVQAPPLGIGLYDEGITLSLANDTQPEPMANWLLHLGTFDGARYPTVTVMLHKPGAEALIPSVLRLREGDMIRLTDLPGFISHEDVDLIVNGYSEVIEPYRWEVTFNCSPGGSWNVAQVENPAYYAKADTDGTVLAAPVGTTDTPLVTQVTAGPQWTEDPAESPFDVVVAGERMRVDAVGGLLSANPWMETDLTGWVGQATGSVAYSTAVHHPRGSASAMVTPTGTGGSNSFAMASRAPGVAGQSYTGCYWVYSPSGYVDFRVSFDWYDAAGSLISTTSQPAQSVPAGQWTFLTYTATAPALTASIVARCRQGTTPPVSSVYYVWGLRLLGPGAGRPLYDSFSRTVANGWGTADTGQAWAFTGGVAADYATNGTVGQHVMNTRNTLRYTTAPSPSADVDVSTDWALDKTAVTDSNYAFLMARYTDTTHLYFARVQVSGTGQAMTLTIRKRNGAEVQLGGSAALGTYTAGTYYTMRLSVIGSTLSAKCWQRGTQEPDAWQIVTTDTDLTAVGSVGCRSLVGTASTQTLPVTASFDNFTINNSQRFAVTRSANGVIKSHAAGESVALARPAIASL